MKNTRDVVGNNPGGTSNIGEPFVFAVFVAFAAFGGFGGFGAFGGSVALSPNVRDDILCSACVCTYV